MRIDKWLWHVRGFKSRTIATDACNAKKVKLNDKSVKPAHEVAVGDTVQFKNPNGLKIYKVLTLIQHRLSPELAKQCYEDFSPPLEKNDKLPSAFYNYPQRERGAGRPTKKERRDLGKWKE